MTKAGDEMVAELAKLLDDPTVKTAAKKEKKDDKDTDKDKDEKCKCGKKDCKCGCKGDSDKCKCKKAEAMIGILRDLTKLASQLDDIEADDASSAVDDALRVIMQTLNG